MIKYLFLLMGIVQTFLGHYDRAVTNVTRWHNPSLGGGGLFHFNPAIETWLDMSHDARLVALDKIRNRRIRGNLREVDARFFVALKERGHDVRPYEYYWRNSRFKSELMGR